MSACVQVGRCTGEACFFEVTFFYKEILNISRWKILYEYGMIIAIIVPAVTMCVCQHLLGVLQHGIIELKCSENRIQAGLLILLQSRD